MKKITVLLLVTVLLLSFAACGGQTTGSETKPAGDTDSPVASQEETKHTSEESGREITFTELVAVDNAECGITVTGIDPDDIWGYTVNILLENRSAEKTYMFAVDSAAINGVVCDPFFAAEVSAGKKANETVTFSTDTLAENGIEEYTDIELTLRVHDNDDWSADPVALETVHIYPYGEEKAEKFVRQAQENDNVIVDNEFVTAIVTGYGEDDMWGYTAYLFLCNKTDKNVMFSADNSSVNGFMIDPFYATTVPAGKCAFSSVSWSDDDLEKNGITEVETIEFEFRAFDKDDWTADDYIKEIITLHP